HALLSRSLFPEDPRDPRRLQVRQGPDRPDHHKVSRGALLRNSAADDRVAKRLEDMDRVGIDVEVISLSTPNVYFTDAGGQPAVARLVNDAYADLVARH